MIAHSGSLGDSALKGPAGSTSAPRPTTSAVEPARTSLSRSFTERLDAALATSTDPLVARRAVAMVLQSAFASFVAYHSTGGTRIGESASLEGLTAPLEGLSDGVKKQLGECAAAGARRGQLITVDAGALGVFLGAGLPGCPGEAIAVVCDAASSGIVAGLRDRISGFELMLQLAAARLSQRHLGMQLARSERNAAHVAALVELIGLLENCRDSESAADRLARELVTHLRAARVMVAICTDDSGTCALTADTGQQTIDDRAEGTRTIQAALQESIARDRVSVWPADDAENRHALLAQAQLAELTSAAALTACPLTDDAGNIAGAICVAFRDDSSAESPGETAEVLARRSSPFLAAAPHSLAVTLQLVSRTSESPWYAMWLSCLSAFSVHRL